MTFLWMKLLVGAWTMGAFHSTSGKLYSRQPDIRQFGYQLKIGQTHGEGGQLIASTRDWLSGRHDKDLPDEDRGGELNQNAGEGSLVGYWRKSRPYMVLVDGADSWTVSSRYVTFLEKSQDPGTRSWREQAMRKTSDRRHKQNNIAQSRRKARRTRKGR